jgi:hypothetical protein
MRADVARRARALIGVRFRSQGRDTGTGLDCAGLVIAAFGLEAARFRRDYRLRGKHRGELHRAMLDDFRRVSRRACRIGDVMMLQVACDQLHLAVRTEAGFVHADARLGRIVETPGAPGWPLLAVYRRRVRQKRGT